MHTAFFGGGCQSLLSVFDASRYSHGSRWLSNQDLETWLRPSKNALLYAGMGVFAGIGVTAMATCLCCRATQTVESQQPQPTDSGGQAVEQTHKDELAMLRKQKMKVLAEQLIAQSRVKKVTAQIMDVEARMHDANRPSADEVEVKAKEAMQATNMLAERSLLSVMAYAAPFVSQAYRVQGILEKRAAGATIRATKLAVNEAKDLLGDLTHAFEVESLNQQMFGNLMICWL